MSSKNPKLDDLIKFDKQFSKDFTVIGTDEAGRGPVAGPVTASAVYFEKFDKDLKKLLLALDDSKKLSPKIRKQLSEEIKKYSSYKIIHFSVEKIEKYNILQASLRAMKESCKFVIKANNLTLPPKVLVDGKFIIPKYKVKQEAVIKGDSKSASIAAASILAKVARDELMFKLSEKFPQYDWHKNKGYPTPAHLSAIQKHGICEHHRKSFLTKYI